MGLVDNIRASRGIAPPSGEKFLTRVRKARGIQEPTPPPAPTAWDQVAAGQPITPTETTPVAPLALEDNPYAPRVYDPMTDATALAPTPVLPTTPPPGRTITSSDKVEMALNSGMRGIASTIGSIPKSAGLATTLFEADEVTKERNSLEQIEREFGMDLSSQTLRRPEAGRLYQAGQAIEDIIPQPRPELAPLKGSFLYDTLPGAAGSMAASIGTGVVGGGIGAPALLTMAATGAAGEAASQYDQATAAGVPFDKASAAAKLGGIIGTSEAIPLERIINRATGGMANKVIKETIKGAIEEGLQEAGQTAAGNLIARNYYDPNRPISEGVAEGAAAGAITGGGASGIAGMIARARARRLGQQPPSQQRLPGQPQNRITQAPTEPKRLPPDFIDAEFTVPEQPINDQRQPLFLPGPSDGSVTLTPEQIDAGIKGGAIKDVPAVSTGGPDALGSTSTPAPALPGQKIGDRIRGKKPQPTPADGPAAATPTAAPPVSPSNVSTPATRPPDTNSGSTPDTSNVAPGVKQPQESPYGDQAVPVRPAPGNGDRDVGDSTGSNPVRVGEGARAPVPPSATPLDAAHDAATSPRNDLPEPTQGQKEAGNYKKGHVRFGGLDISIENPIGSERKGVDKGGKPWSVPMTAHYGYIRRTEGADGDHVDVYLPDQPREDAPVHVFNQHDPATGKFDEHKVVLGAESIDAAKRIYDAHFSDGSGPQRRASFSQMSLQDFKQGLESGQFKKALDVPATAVQQPKEIADGKQEQGAQGQARDEVEGQGQGQGNQEGLLTPSPKPPAASSATAAQPASSPLSASARTPAFKRGDRVVNEKGWTGTVEQDAGAWNVSVRWDNYPPPLPMESRPHKGLKLEGADGPKTAESAKTPAPAKTGGTLKTESSDGVRSSETGNTAPVVGGPGPSQGAVAGPAQEPAAQRPAKRPSRSEAGASLPDDHTTPQEESKPNGGGSTGDGASGVALPTESEVRPDGDKDARPSNKRPAASVREQNVRNHVIEDADEIAPPGDVGKLKANIAALKIAKSLGEREATPEQKKALAKYTGWGQLSNAFDKGAGEAMLKDRSWQRRPDWEKKWGTYYKQLRELLTEEEFNQAAESTLFAHYTSREVITAMWKIAHRLGFGGGSVLEPAAGVGHFFGLMPKAMASKSKLVGIEIDPISSLILSKLYPDANLFSKGFEDVKLKPNSIDLAITNVPFNAQGPASSKDEYGVTMNLHNYFIARMLDMVKPGGHVIAISSHFTLDANRDQRQVIADRGQLVAAIRLPNNAFKANAGTEVVTDIIVLRKPDGRSWGAPEDFLSLGQVDAGKDKQALVNSYYVRHPEMMLGTPSLEGTMRGGEDEFTLIPDKSRPLSEQLDEAMQVIDEQGIRTIVDLVEDVAASAREGEAARSFKDGTLLRRNGKLVVVSDGKFVDAGEYSNKLGKGKEKQADDFIGLRDHYQSHLQTMLKPESTDADVAASQKQLNKLYDDYIEKHGHINQVSSKAFKFDPSYFLLASLENNVSKPHPDKPGELYYTWEKSDVFRKRTIAPRSAPSFVSSVSEAIGVSLAYKGQLDIDYIAQLTNKTPEEITAEFEGGDSAYENPKTGIWEPRDEYLSGPVRVKLREAKAAGMKRNIEALEKVQPARIAIKDVSFRLGSSWLPTKAVEQFAHHLMGARGISVNYNMATDQWSVRGGEKRGAKATQEWGTERKPFPEILEAILNMRSPTVYDTVPKDDGKGTKQVVNPVQTAAAEAVAERVQEEFSRIINTSEKAKDLLEEAYHDKFNGYVVPKFDGMHLTLPGSSASVNLRYYQKGAVWRMLKTGSTLLAHAPGAGKTYTMIAAAMEMRRLGIARKPVIVVQNSTLMQFATSFRRMYPMANVLVATKEDLESSKRKVFMSRIASGDYDAIVIAHSSFNLLPNDPNREMDWIAEQIAELEEALYEAKANDPKSITVKQIQSAIRSLKKKLGKIAEKAKEHKDDVVNFEELGIDAIFIDEAHAYKKVPLVTKLQRVGGIATDSSQRAFSLLMKTKHVQDKMNGKNVFLATGTPVTNTLGESWTMMKLVSPQALKDFNVETFNRFVGVFTNPRPELEMNAGGNWVRKTMLSRFINGPELQNFLRSTWDVITTEDLHAIFKEQGINMPEIEGGKPEIVSVPLSPAVAEFKALLSSIYQRYTQLQGKEKKIYSYIPVLTYNAARSAALDIRLVYPNAKDDPGSKVNVLARRVFKIWEQTRDKRSTQLIFCDSFNHVNMSKLVEFAGGGAANITIEEEPDDPDAEESVPPADTDMFLYRDIKKKLVKMGIPEAEVAIINDFDTDKKKEALFTRVNAGDVAVVMGGTERLGTGVNVQERVIAMHNLDAPWTPAALEQRNARGLRFGNTNKYVGLLNYGMVDTLDAAIYTKILRKAQFIQQVLGGKAIGREFEDPANASTMSAQEQQAALAGDPMIFRRIELQQLVRTLGIEREAFLDQAERGKYAIKNAKRFIGDQQAAIPKWEAIDAVTSKLDPEKFNGTIDGKKITDRDAGVKAMDAAIKKAEADFLEQAKAGNVKAGDLATHKVRNEGQKIAEFNVGGVDVTIKAAANRPLNKGEGGKGISYGPWETRISTDLSVNGREMYDGEAKTAEGIVSAVEKLKATVKAQLKQMADSIVRYEKEIAELTELQTRTWPKEEELKKATADLKFIEEAIAPKEKPKEGGAGANPDLSGHDTADYFRRAGLGPNPFGGFAMASRPVVYPFIVNMAGKVKRAAKDAAKRNKALQRILARQRGEIGTAHLDINAKAKQLRGLRDWLKLDPENSYKLNRAMVGQFPMNMLPRAAQKWVKEARAMHDAASRDLIDELVMAHGGENHLTESIRNNIGTYLAETLIPKSVSRKLRDFATRKHKLRGEQFKFKRDKWAVRVGKRHFKFDTQAEAHAFAKDLVNQAKSETIKKVAAARGVTADDLNRLAAKHRKIQVIKPIPEDQRREMFIRDPLTQWAISYAKTRQNAANLQAFRMIDRRFAEPAPVGMTEAEVETWAKENGYEQVKGTKNTVGVLAGKYAPKRVAREVNEMVRAVGKLERIWTGYLNLWKTSKTVWNPATHFRNVAGNAPFADFAGVDPTNPLNLRWYVAAAKELSAQGDDYRWLTKQGVLGAEYFGNEVERTTKYLEAAPETAFDALIKAGQSISDAMGRAYNVEDQIFKMAAYLKLRSRGVPRLKAARQVNRWFPNYAELNPTVRTLSRRVVGAPFLAFNEQAARIAGRALVSHPLKLAKWAAMPGILTAIGMYLLGLDDDERELVNSRRGYAEPVLPSRDSKGAVRTLDLRYVLPWANELQGFLGSDKELVLPGLLQQPIVGGAVDASRNRDIFTHREIYKEDDTAATKIGKSALHMLKGAAPVPSLLQFGIPRIKQAATGESRESVLGAVAGAVTGVNARGQYVRREDAYNQVRELAKRDPKVAAFLEKAVGPTMPRMSYQELERSLTLNRRFQHLLDLFNEAYRRPFQDEIKPRGILSSIRARKAAELKTKKAG